MALAARVSSLFLMLLLFALTSVPVLAQMETATLSGVINDPNGAVVPDAEVTVTRIETGTVMTTKTNGAGIYSFTSLMPGHYHLVVRKPGFKEIAIKDFELYVQDKSEQNFSLEIGSVSETVTVMGTSSLVNTQSAAVSTVIDHNFVESLPLNGRSFNMLLQLTPGVVIAQQAQGSSGNASGQFSIAGQRTDANSFTVDGVSANFGISTTGLFSGESGTGSAQAFSVLGGTSSLVSVEALQEFRVETSSFAPEFGKTPGGQVILTTRPGTNDLHGGLYEYFRNDVMDANDWFANQAGNPRAPERHNDFGGFLGGPIARNKTFFFLSYEGARLRLPQTTVIEVPFLNGTTCSAPSSIAPFLLAYPKPNGPVSAASCTGQLTGTYSNIATLDAGSIRIDHMISTRFSIFGRYNYAPSQTVSRVDSLSMLETSPVNTQTLTLGLNMILNNLVTNTVRGNYSTQVSNLVSSMDSFLGATPINPSLILGSLPPANNIAAFETFDTNFYSTGPIGRNRTRQANVVDDLTIEKGPHQLKVGIDYRAITLDKAPSANDVALLAASVQDFLSTGTVSLVGEVRQPTDLLTQSFSAYAQDVWKASPRLTVTYGLRWELAPAPAARNGTTLASWTNVGDPANLTLAPFGTPLWATTYGNFAPRFGIAYSPTERGDFVIRGGVGVFYDLGVGAAADVGSFFPGGATLVTPGVVVPTGNVNPFLPTISLQPPYPDVDAFSPNLSLPRSYQWNLAFEKSFGARQVVTVTYVGQAGRNLLRQQSQFQPNSDFQGTFLLTTNSARSNYNALQTQYRRPLSKGLQVLLNYTWSHSLDNASNDVVAGLNTVISGENDYASSGFDVRQSFSGAITYSVPGVGDSRLLRAVTRDWTLASIIVARTGFPFNEVVVLGSPDPGGFAESRPDIVPGQPVWIPDATAGGGKSLNPNAFVVPSTLRQGTEGRNDIPGFGLTQVDLSIGRNFPMTERLNLLFRVDAFNALNHPNFTNPPGDAEFGPAFLRSQEMLNVGLGGLNPVFQEGGPRSLQLSLKLTF